MLSSLDGGAKARASDDEPDAGPTPQQSNQLLTQYSSLLHNNSNYACYAGLYIIGCNKYYYAQLLIQANHTQ